MKNEELSPSGLSGECRNASTYVSGILHSLRRVVGALVQFGRTWSGRSSRERTARLLASPAVFLLGLLCLPGAFAQTVTYIHTDVQGSVIAESDANGVVTRRVVYEPYGAEVNGQTNDRPGYAGHVSDSMTGLSQMQQRYYDPQIGMFLSVDPVTAYSDPVSQFHRYRYANNNPYRFTDPDGRQSVGEMIDSGAEGCGPVSCAGWATLSAAWTVLGAEGISQISDKGWGSVNSGDRVGAGLEIAAVLPPVKMLRGASLIAKEGIMSMNFSRPQLQHAFKHAGDFGVAGNANNKTLTEFGSAIERHVASDSTVAIQGTYRGNDVTHFVDPATGLNVMKDSSGSFLSGWKLSNQQLNHVLESGSLGGSK